MAENRKSYLNTEALEHPKRHRLSCVLLYPIQEASLKHVSYSLNSLKGGSIVEYCRVY